MSWSVTFIGTPDKVSAALDEHSQKIGDQSKIEFDEALPHLKGLVEQNFNKQFDSTTPVIKLSASGSGYSVNGEQKQRQCSVTIEQLWGVLV